MRFLEVASREAAYKLPSIIPFCCPGTECVTEAFVTAVHNEDSGTFVHGGGGEQALITEQKVCPLWLVACFSLLECVLPFRLVGLHTFRVGAVYLVGVRSRAFLGKPMTHVWISVMNGCSVIFLSFWGKSQSMRYEHTGMAMFHLHVSASSSRDSLCHVWGTTSQ